MKTYSITLFVILLGIGSTYAQGTDNGFRLVRESQEQIFYEDINTDNYKGSPKDSLGNPLSLYGIKFEARDELSNLEKSIFSLEERKQIQGYGHRAGLAFFTIEAATGNIVCVSFIFRNIDESFSINVKKLAKYREEIKKNIRYHYLSFEGGGDVVSGYLRQIIPVFID